MARFFRVYDIAAIDSSQFFMTTQFYFDYPTLQALEMFDYYNFLLVNIYFSNLFVINREYRSLQWEEALCIGEEIRNAHWHFI